MRLVGTDLVRGWRFALVCFALAPLWWALLLIPTWTHFAFGNVPFELGFSLVATVVVCGCYAFRYAYRRSPRLPCWIAGALAGLVLAATAFVVTFPSLEDGGGYLYLLPLAIANAWYVVIPMSGFTALLLIELE